MFAEAQERAKYLDELRAQGKLAGPLHGLPISLKDNFHCKGTEATIGMVSFLDDVSTENSPLVEMLLLLGAVIYVKTNVPQTMMVRSSEPYPADSLNLTCQRHRTPIIMCSDVP